MTKVNVLIEFYFKKVDRAILVLQFTVENYSLEKFLEVSKLKKYVTTYEQN